jgi:hypothetical protein
LQEPLQRFSLVPSRCWHEIFLSIREEGFLPVEQGAAKS